MAEMTSEICFKILHKRERWKEIRIDKTTVAKSGKLLNLGDGYMGLYYTRAVITKMFENNEQ